jgi:hypothetical protein
VPSAVSKTMAVRLFNFTLWSFKSIHHQVERKGNGTKANDTREIHVEHLQKSSEVKVQSEKEKEKKKMSALHKSMSESHKRNMTEKRNVRDKI